MDYLYSDFTPLFSFLYSVLWFRIEDRSGDARLRLYELPPNHLPIARFLLNTTNWSVLTRFL